MFRRLVYNRLALVLMLGLAFMHATPTGVIVCASDNGLRFEFACSCGEGTGQACGCGGGDCSSENGDDESSLCSDHTIELAAARAVEQPKPQFEYMAVLPVLPVLVPVAGHGKYSTIAESPPPLLSRTSVVLLI